MALADEQRVLQAVLGQIDGANKSTSESTMPGSAPYPFWLKTCVKSEPHLQPQ